MRILKTALILVGTVFFAVPARAFDDAEEWGGYWRQFERPTGRRYEAPKPLYYGHAPPAGPVRYYSDPAAFDEIDYRQRRTITPGLRPGADFPQFYRRGSYYGPAISPYYAPGRVSYGGIRYGWW